ncbi:MAG: 4Fe-4S binding protein [Desulfobacteraceae bacterium]|nr:4Fe-4S binding protein [Desulfobacteraceae bacterium]
MSKPKLKALTINRPWCKGCGICVAFCPAKVLELDHEEKAVAVRIEDCIACSLCALRCPDLAIEVEIAPEDNEIAPPAQKRILIQNRGGSRS